MMRRTLGARLARIVGIATFAGLLAFAGVTLFVLWIDEEDKEDTAESTFDELAEHLVLAFSFAAPVAIAVAVGGAHWATRRATSRIDRVIASAAEVTVDNLALRVPLSGDADELDALIRALNALLERIDQGVASQARFAADASHELRTPLAAMIGALEVARRRPREPAEWERVADGVLVEARHLAQLAEGLLQLSRGAADAEKLAPLQVDDAVAGIVERWRAADTGVELVVAATSHATITIDPRTFAIAVGNVIDNALAWSPRGAVVEVTTYAADHRVFITVDDAGPGVPEEARERIFGAFVRVGTAPRGGAGLGLSIAKRICEASGGTIQVTRGARGGARFTICLAVAGSPHEH
jgi:signal transduction histidine kinase